MTLYINIYIYGYIYIYILFIPFPIKWDPFPSNGVHIFPWYFHEIPVNKTHKSDVPWSKYAIWLCGHAHPSYKWEKPEKNCRLIRMKSDDSHPPIRENPSRWFKRTSMSDCLNPKYIIIIISYSIYSHIYSHIFPYIPIYSHTYSHIYIYIPIYIPIYFHIYPKESHVFTMPQILAPSSPLLAPRRRAIHVRGE